MATVKAATARALMGVGPFHPRSAAWPTGITAPAGRGQVLMPGDTGEAERTQMTRGAGRPSLVLSSSALSRRRPGHDPTR